MRVRNHYLIIILVFIVSVFSINASAKQLFSIHGSNTIGSQLAPALVKAYLNQQYEATNVRYVERQKEEGVVMGYQRQTGQKLEVEIFSHGSSTGFKSLNSNAAQIAMSSRPIKDKEVSKLSFLGDMKSFKSENVIGLDGIAVIVHKSNPISAISREQLTSIFSGKINHWQQLGEAFSAAKYHNKRINVYVRDDKSGTYDTFKKLVLVNKSKLVKNAKRFESNAHLSDKVAVDRFAIGFVGLPYIRQSKGLSVSEGAGKPRLPNALTVATEDYALSRRLYMYIAEQEDNKDVTNFIEFVAQEAGQKVVDEIGFVSQNVYASEVKVPDFYPEEYKQLTKNAQRLSVNIHFNHDTLEPDNRAIHDLERIAKFIKSRKSIKDIMLFGFSEDNDFTMFNISLSESRADYVQLLLKPYGLTVTKMRGYGAVNPVAMNSAIEKNRRVEIWIK